MIDSAIVLTRASGTMVAIMEKASDCAGSLRDLRSDSIAFVIDFQISTFFYENRILAATYPVYFSSYLEELISPAASSKPKSTSYPRMWM